MHSHPCGAAPATDMFLHLRRVARQSTVAGQRLNVEEHIAIDHVGVAIVDDAGYGVNHGGNVRRGTRLQRRRQAPQLPHVLVELVDEPAKEDGRVCCMHALPLVPGPWITLRGSASTCPAKVSGCSACPT